ncbi:putative endo alpha-1,4 polygalactosaminidase precursor [Papiliotrema laurentii]|uniref:alpha-galactosidase n=1 Tax=Papiliotrema laurentii TaxID=5418 RepID=A0AAD9FXK7_PAPLA|nr:putative endo alpha-1,4 polygalactosaminidase precursor [Papiliotrema laurentii]
MYILPPCILLTLVVVLPVCLAGDKCGRKTSTKDAATGSPDESPTEALGSPNARPTPTSRTAQSTSPLPTGGGGGKVTLDSTFIYELDNTPVDSPTISSSSGVKVDGSVYIVDMEHSTPEQITKYKADGKTVICYFSAGTWEPGRGDASSFEGSCVCKGGKLGSSSCSSSDNKMSDWNEWWLDIHSDECKASVQNVMAARIKSAKAKGCDGVDPDNVDSYINTDEQKHGNTEQDQVDYLTFLSTTARENGLLIDLKNGGDLLKGEHKDAIVAAFDFSVIEQCHKYDECDVYKPMLAAGKPNFQIEYGGMSSCPSLSKGQHLLVYSQDTLDTRKITLAC